jgi:hypothetical protein
MWTTVATRAAAALVELAFWGHGGHDALSDIPGRFFAWNLHPSVMPYGGRPIEYPVVIGYVSWVTGWLGHGASGFFVAQGAIAIALALTMTVMIYHRAPDAIWRWSAGIPLALYAFHNWDLVAMVPTIAGLLAFDRGKNRTSGALLALGAFAKVFPAFALPPLLYLRWRSGDRRGAFRLACGFGVVALVLNGPVATFAWRAWTFPASFQGGRPPTWGSLWHWLFAVPGAPVLWTDNAKAIADGLSIIAMVSFLVVISVLAVRRRLDAVAVGAAVVGAFLLCNKVYSPNYDLWLLPFFALLPVSRRVLTGYVASALSIFVLVYGYLHGGWPIGVVVALMPSLVIVRAMMIVALIATALRDHRAASAISSSSRADRKPSPLQLSL